MSGFLLCVLWLISRGGKGETEPLPTGELYLSGQIDQIEDRELILSHISYFQASDPTNASQKTLQYSQKLICRQTNAPKELKIGEIIFFYGAVSAFLEATNPGQFDAKAYYGEKGIGGQVTIRRFLSSDGKAAVIPQFFHDLRDSLEKRIYERFEPREAQVLSAMLLGDKTGLDRELKQTYQRNGIVHILSISGLHITLLAAGLYRLLSLLGLTAGWKRGLTAGCLVFYMALTGFPLSCVRAGGMYLLYLLAQRAQATYDRYTALAVLAVVSALVYPDCFSNMGFWFSYLAVLGIGLYKRAPALAVYIVTLPIQLLSYYEAPLLSVFLNLFVVLTVPVIVLCGLLALLPFLGFLRYGVWVLLTGYDFLCTQVSRLGFAMLRPGKPGVLPLVLFALLVVAGLWARSRWKREWLLWSSSFLAVLVLLIPAGGRARILFLDVGQGACVLMESEKGETVLFDCGSTSEKNIGDTVLWPALNYLGIRRLDRVVLSHPDRDHYSGLIPLLEDASAEGLSIGQVVVPEDLSGADELLEVLKQFERRGGEVVQTKVGELWEQEGMQMLCLNPDGTMTGNDSSYSFLVSMKKKDGGIFTLLLTGDVEQAAEERIRAQLSKRGIRRIDELQVAHHGSDTSTKELFLKGLQIGSAVISCKDKNSYGHPSPRTIERLTAYGITIYETRKVGAIQFLP